MGKNANIIISLLFSFIFYCCTPYNSDKVNTGLIQGKWVLSDTDRPLYDTVEIDYNKELTYLIFEGNKCTQHMTDWKDTLQFTFIIRNFELSLYRDNKAFRRLDIEALSDDSLVLSFPDNKWIYKKVGS